MKRLITVALAVVVVLTLGLVPVAPAAAADSDPGPVLAARWSFDEGIGSTASDSSGNGNDGTLFGGKFGNALSFDGVDDYVDFGDKFEFGTGESFTAECWVKTSATPALRTEVMGIYGGPTYPTPNQFWAIFLEPSGKASFWLRVSNGATQATVWGTTVLTDGEWHHIAGVKDVSAGELRLFIDGSQEGGDVTFTDGPTANNYPFRIGNGCWDRYYSGLIDEVRISNVATASFDLLNPPSADGNTVALWHFDESVGSTAYDETANHNDGTINGASWAGPTWTSGMSGIYNGALSFDGVDDYVEVLDNSALDITGDLTIEAWVKVNSFTYPHSFFIGKDAPGQRSYGLWVDGGYYSGKTGKVGFIVFKSSSQYTIHWGSTTLETGQWYHIAGTYDYVADGTSVMKIFVDGMLDSPETTNAVGPIFSGSANLQIGARQYPPDFWRSFVNGSIDEVRIWSSVLDASQLDDMTGPVVSDITANPTPVSLAPTFMATVTDGTGTGVELVKYRVDGGAWQDMDLQSGDIYQATLDPYGEAGLHTIEVQGFDYAKNAGQIASTLLAIYDPSAGFVTGGGWIYSAPGAYEANPDAEGKANFGFVSKYKKGATAPDGQTEFQFKAGDLNFHSTSYEWLVVTDSDYARFKGAGTIDNELDPNGNPYKFMLWAGDGTGTDGADTFRIKIWYEVGDTEYVIYDNGMDQAIGGGSIVVHTSKK